MAITDQAQRLYDDSIVVDCLNGSALTAPVIGRLRAAHVTAINLTAVQIGRDFDGALRDLADVCETIARHPDDLMIAREPDDVRRAKFEHRTAIILGMQDAEPIGRELTRLRTLATLGVRIIQLTHNRQNYVGTGCAEPDGGLTRFGRLVVAEMNRLGIMVDLAHCGPETTCDAIEMSALPVMISHSNPQTIAGSLRNKDDEAIRLLADRGGLIGMATWAPIVYRGDDRRPTIEDVLDCFDHACRIAGPEHVAIGSDLCEDASPTPQAWADIYGPGGQYPEITGGLGDWYGFDTVNAAGLETITDLPKLAAGLLARDHAPTAIKAMLGENFLRLFARVRAR
jgi:membrane dipeptidase